MPHCSRKRRRKASASTSSACRSSSPSCGRWSSGSSAGRAVVMTGAIRLNAIDLTIFAAYMVLAVALGFLVSRRGRTSAQAYFLGGKTLPWYVVATSMVAADVSAEHFIANAGVAYKYGIVPATASWNARIIYSLFIWIFLPYYVRTCLYTVPQFLERRYNVACRYIFSGSLVAGYVAAIIAGSLFAGAIALQRMLGPFFADAAGEAFHGTIAAV